VSYLDIEDGWSQDTCSAAYLTHRSPCAQVRQLLFAGVENAKRPHELMEAVRIFKVTTMPQGMHAVPSI
jgi:hypothetical protein